MDKTTTVSNSGDNVVKFCIVAERQIDRFKNHILQYNVKEVWLMDDKPVALGYTDLRNAGEPAVVKNFEESNTEVSKIREVLKKDHDKRLKRLSMLDFTNMPMFLYPDDFPEDTKTIAWHGIGEVRKETIL